MLSKTTGYAVAAMSCLESLSGRLISVRDVASCTGISRSYLSKIIQTLAEKKLVKTKRGYTGGLLLARPAEEITLSEIVEAVEGADWIGKCLLGWDQCDGSCPIHDFWKEERERIETELRARKLSEFIDFRGCVPMKEQFYHRSSSEMTGGLK